MSFAEIFQNLFDLDEARTSWHQIKWNGITDFIKLPKIISVVLWANFFSINFCTSVQYSIYLFNERKVQLFNDHNLLPTPQASFFLSPKKNISICVHKRQMAELKKRCTVHSSWLPTKPRLATYSLRKQITTIFLFEETNNYHNCAHKINRPDKPY